MKHKQPTNHLKTLITKIGIPKDPFPYIGNDDPDYRLSQNQLADINKLLDKVEKELLKDSWFVADNSSICFNYKTWKKYFSTKPLA